MITLLHGDCLDLMPSIPDGSIDLVLADLPYGTTACKWDTIIPLEPLWKEYKRVIKRNGAIVLTASQPFTSVLVMSNPKWFKYAWVWSKGTVSNFQLANVMPLKEHEDICVFAENSAPYIPQMTPKEEPIDKRNWSLANKRPDALGHLNSKSLDAGRRVLTHSYPRSILPFNAYAGEANGIHRLHPTQKPVALMEYLIRTYTNEGETVLDNTCGSGTTLVACVNTNRNGIGIEKDAGYFEIAQRRIQEAQNKARQLTLLEVAS